MNSPLLVPALGLAYIVIFGFSFWLRREGLPMRFAVEGVALTVLGTLGAFAFGLSPILFLIVLYLITMRTRILSDIGNFLSNEGHMPEALLLFNAADKLAPDSIGRLIVAINRGVALVRMNRLPEAVNVFQQALESATLDSPVRHLAAAHYNLGLALMRLGEMDQARQHFLTVLDIAPETMYAIGARTGLRRQTQMASEMKGSSAEEPTSAQTPAPTKDG